MKALTDGVTRLHRYRFCSVWTLPASPDVVYSVLDILERYPLWWREVKEVTQIDDRTARVVVRSRLPYDLAFTTEQEKRDPETRVLEARMMGDLDGFSRWTIAPDPMGSKAVFEEDVIAKKRLLRILAPAVRLALIANHTLMMRSGEMGLRTYLAGFDHPHVTP